MVVPTSSTPPHEIAPRSEEHARALQTLWRLRNKLQDAVSAQVWRDAARTEEFNAAVLHALRAAEEASAGQKRELIWFGFINGWVRLGSDPERDRFLRIVANFDLQHFQILEKIKET